MPLAAYKKKRTLSTTPEPKGGKSTDSSLHFVVQKHHASRLHYDFRLELRGVLKSWAVPKGPSLSPQDKRLAVEVEDHPFDYKDFEGIIPKGNYGAGTVIVWDQGTYEPIGVKGDKKTLESAVAKQLKSGSIKLLLKGKKLKGEFALVRMKTDEQHAWLLIKHDDRHASDTDVTQLDKSVLSKKTLDEIAGSEKKASKRKAQAKQKRKTEQTVTGSVQQQLDPTSAQPNKAGSRDAKAIVARAKPAKRPQTVSPMLATLVDEPFDDASWEFEVKWDGYRAIASRDGDYVALESRNGKSFAEKFPPVFDAIQEWGIRAVVDGEVVAIDENGVANFNALQNWRDASDGQLAYYVFDLLWYEGKDLTKLPLSDRKSVLQSIVPAKGIIRIGYSVQAEGVAFLDAAEKLGLEGMIAKRSDSVYRPGDRSKDWLKVKLQRRQEVVIGGYTRNEGTSKAFSSLLLGVYKADKLQYVGKVGTGFSDKEQQELLARFKPLVRKTSPFAGEAFYDKRSHFNYGAGKAEAVWLRPSLVCEVRYTEVTPEGVFRHPAFLGIREDKDPKNVVAERAQPSADARGDTNKTKRNAKLAFAGRDDKKLVRKVGGKSLTFTNLDKVYWPDVGYTKGDMVEYYANISKYILPYLKNRPQSLNRFPDGIKGKSFYQKDVTDTAPDWVEKYPYRSKGERQLKNYMLCNDQATLLYMANLGTIELNPWSSTIAKPDHPTWCLLDLDPDTGNTFDQVIEVAKAIHALLEDANVPSYCKTSGSTGLHIYVPFGNKYSYEQSQLFAKWVATQVDAEFSFTSIERMTKRRKGKIYIDYLQNRPAATLAAPYSVRPKPGATVSMPLYWEEVKKGLEITDFTMENALARVMSEGDIFKAVLGRGIDLKKLLKRMQAE